jgi:hypothetical protein
VRRAAAALAGALLLCGCTYHVRRVGDDHFLGNSIEWVPGRTSVADVVTAFGPPDVVRWSIGRLYFVYRAERRVVASLALSFYLRLFSDEQGRKQDATLLVAFDDADRLLYYGVSEEPREDLAGDLGLR